ncbi:MAG: acyl carrier protein [Pseudomonadota bacterium]
MLTESFVIETVADLLDLEETDLTADTRFEEISGWDSVNALRLLVFLERELGGKIDYDRFMATQRLGDLWEQELQQDAAVAS